MVLVDPVTPSTLITSDLRDANEVAIDKQTNTINVNS